MTTAWAYPPDMHPWFRAPSLKRKALDEQNSSGPPASPRSKRRRYDILEHGLTSLSLYPYLDNHSVSPVHPPSPSKHTFDNAREVYASLPLSLRSVQPVAAPLALAPSANLAEFPSASVILPTSVEEPTSPESTSDLPDIQMKTRSWYEIEKDRIVITDLEDSEDEGEIDTAGTGKDLSVSPALLGRLSKQSRSLVVPEFLDTSKALVLFRPLVPPAKVAHDSPPATEHRITVEEVDGAPMADADIAMDIAVDDAMDVEPI